MTTDIHETEAERSIVHGLLALQSEFKASMGNLVPHPQLPKSSRVEYLPSTCKSLGSIPRLRRKQVSVCFWPSFTDPVEGFQADSREMAWPSHAWTKAGRGAWGRGQARSKPTSLLLPGQTWLMDHRAHSQRPSYGGQWWLGVTQSV